MQLPPGDSMVPPRQVMVPPDPNEGVLPKDDNKGGAVNKGQHDHPLEALSKQYLVVPGLLMVL